MQFAAGARVGPQVLSSVYEAAAVPVIAMDVMFNVEAPELVIVTDCAGEVVPCVVAAKVKVVGLRVTDGFAVPVPVTVTFCGEPAALSTTLKVPVRAPADSGLNAT